MNSMNSEQRTVTAYSSCSVFRKKSVFLTHTHQRNALELIFAYLVDFLHHQILNSIIDGSTLCLPSGRVDTIDLFTVSGDWEIESSVVSHYHYPQSSFLTFDFRSEFSYCKLIRNQNRILYGESDHKLPSLAQIVTFE